MEGILEMWNLAKIAMRNVGRNKRRTFITVFTVFLGVFVVTFSKGLLNGLQGEVESALTRKVHGDLQIHKRGYEDSLENNPYKVLINYNEAAYTKTLHHNLQAASPRLRVMGMLNHQESETNTPIMVTGIDSKSELSVCPRIKTSIVLGHMLDSNSERSGERPHQLLLTPALIRGLGAQIGDEVAIFFQDVNNIPQMLKAKIIGVVDYGLPNLSARMVWMDFTTLQEALSVQGKASEIVFKTELGSSLDQTKEDLGQVLSSDLIVESWRDVAGFYSDAMALQDVIYSVVMMIMFIIVISGIVNTSLMVVMERTREIGTLMALGFKRRHILFLFLSESALIGCLGGVIGVVFTSCVIAYLGRVGIIMTLPGEAVKTVLFPFVSFSFLLLVLGLAFAAALFAGVLPAYRASRMKPVEALNAI